MPTRHHISAGFVLRGWGGPSIAVGIVSVLFYVFLGFVWVAEVWARGTYRELPLAPLVFGVWFGGSTILGAALVAAGIGLLQNHRWGQRTALTYAISTVVLQASVLALRIGYVNDVLMTESAVQHAAYSAYAIALLVAWLLCRGGITNESRPTANQQ